MEESENINRPLTASGSVDFVECEEAEKPKSINKESAIFKNVTNKIGKIFVVSFKNKIFFL